MATKSGGGAKGTGPKVRVEPIRPMSREEANREMERFFQELQEELKDVPQAVIETGAKRVLDFLKGELTWGEIFNIPPHVQQRIAEFGYMQFQAGRYEDAERFFKVLTILNWQNSYYHSMMGSVLQRQKRYGEAIASYTQAIDLNPSDIVSLTNRGEIFFRHGLLEDAEQDFERAITLDPKGENKWGNQARQLRQQIAQVRGRQGGTPTGKPGGSTKQ